MNKNTLIISVFSVIAIFGFLTAAYVFTNKPDTSNQTVNREMMKVSPTDHTKWSKTNKNVLVEYADFECPACAGSHQFIKTELDNDKNITQNITFVFRHYPLYQIHEYAQESAYAVEAAGKQDKFFEMSSLLFENQKQWTESKDVKKQLLIYAKKLKLNEEQFIKDMDSKEVKDKVNNDLLSGEQAGVNSTPTFFYNGKRIEVNSYDEFKKLIKDGMKK